jgi:hypothetical protein
MTGCGLGFAHGFRWMAVCAPFLSQEWKVPGLFRSQLPVRFRLLVKPLGINLAPQKSDHSARLLAKLARQTSECARIFA